MTTGKDEAQAFVRHGAIRHRGYRRGVLGLDHPAHFIAAFGEARLPAHPVDGLVARHANNPRAWVIGHPISRPLLQRRGKRFLDRVFGELEVSDRANHAGQNSPELVPIESGKSLVFHIAARMRLPHRAARATEGEAAGQEPAGLHLPYLARLDVEERRKLLRPLKRFSLGRAVDQEVTPDYLLGLQEWTIGNGPNSIPTHSHGPRLRTKAS